MAENFYADTKPKESASDSLLNQLEKAKKEGKVKKIKPKSKYIQKKTVNEKINKLFKTKVYGETDLLK